MKNRKRTALLLILLCIAIVLLPLFLLPGAEFEGSDGQGSDMVDELTGGSYEPWFEPILETILGGELPGEMETLFFCIQTGLGVGVLAYCFGYLVARKKYEDDGVGSSSPKEKGIA